MENQQELLALRHSLSHILAHAVLNLYPSTKTAIGPAISDGFYYDFEFEEKITEDDLKLIEKEMIKIINKKHEFIQKDISSKEALDMFKNQPYKIQLINDLNLENVSLYSIGDFTDLCRGPHIEKTSQIPKGCFKLRNIAGAYWRGDEKNKMLTRIYGYAFLSNSDLKDYLKKLEELKQRDHRRIGKDLELFSFSQKAGEGLMFWHPNGAHVRSCIEAFWKMEHQKNGYEIIYTPHIGKKELWQTSEHLSFYKDSMYSPIDIDGYEYYLKPMNCPFHLLIYSKYPKSYKQLPIRYCELGTVYRYERSGTLYGSLRVRGFTQDDAHIICTQDQVEEELDKTLKFSLYMLKTFGFKDFTAYISTMPDEHVGDDQTWEFAQKKLELTLQNNNIPYDVDLGGGAFYGPKIDLKITDSLNRQWQLSTLQFDFNLPKKFDITYTDKNSNLQTPFMIHRALLGSLERFFGILTEHFKGKFPTWLSYKQVCIIPIAPSHVEYAKKLDLELKMNMIKSNVDLSDNRFNAKIRENISENPYLVIIGDNEIENNQLSIKQRGCEKNFSMKKDEFVSMLKEKITNKDLV